MSRPKKLSVFRHPHFWPMVICIAVHLALIIHTIWVLYQYSIGNISPTPPYNV